MQLDVHPREVQGSTEPFPWLVSMQMVVKFSFLDSTSRFHASPYAAKGGSRGSPVTLFLFFISVSRASICWGSGDLPIHSHPVQPESCRHAMV